MTRYAYVQNSDDTITKTIEYDKFDATAVTHKFGADKDVRIIPFEKVVDPSYDSATQRLTLNKKRVLVDKVEVYREVESIPKTELDEATERTQIKAIYTKLKNGTATSAQVQNVLARVVKDFYS